MQGQLPPGNGTTVSFDEFGTGALNQQYRRDRALIFLEQRQQLEPVFDPRFPVNIVDVIAHRMR